MKDVYDGFYGVIAEQYDERDFIFGGDLIIPDTKHKFEEFKIQYNQKTVSKMSCTVFGSMGAVSDLTGYTFNLGTAKGIWEEAKKLGASDTRGWYISSAVNLVQKRYNELYPKDTVSYYRVQLCSEEAIEALNKGYSLVVGFSGNRNYTNDKNDGVLDGTDFGATTYGHCVRLYKSGDKYIVDNYDGQVLFNIYQLKDLNTLVDNSVFFKNAYFYVKDNELKEAENMGKISPWAREAVKYCIDNNIATVWDNPQEIVTSVDAERMYRRAGIIKSFSGKGLSKERLAIIIKKSI